MPTAAYLEILQLTINHMQCVWRQKKDFFNEWLWCMLFLILQLPKRRELILNSNPFPVRAILASIFLNPRWGWKKEIKTSSPNTQIVHNGLREREGALFLLSFFGLLKIKWVKDLTSRR